MQKMEKAKYLNRIQKHAYTKPQMLVVELRHKANLLMQSELNNKQEIEDASEII